MRIAISGTHCSGKTTLIDKFLLAHPDFIHEPEPYTVLVEDYGEDFSEEPSLEDIHRQLEFNVDRLRHHRSDERVIYERSPIDYLAYMLALEDLRRDNGDSSLVQSALRLVIEAIRNLDVIVFLPLDDADGIEVPESEDPKLRVAVDSRLVGILEKGELDLGDSGCPLIVEARGSTEQRLRTLEDMMSVGLNA